VNSRYGRLAQEIRKLGIGSLNDSIFGEAKVSFEYDQEALQSIFNVLEPQAATLKKLSYYLFCLAASQYSSLEFEFTSLSDAIESIFEKHLAIDNDFIKEIIKSVKTPGYFAGQMFRLLELLANGEDGIIFSLRKQVQDKFGKFYNWESTFIDTIRNYSNNVVEQVVAAAAAAATATATSATSNTTIATGDDDEEETMASSSTSVSFESLLNEVLPEIIDFKNVAESISSLTEQRKFFLDIISDDNVRLSR